MWRLQKMECFKKTIRFIVYLCFAIVLFANSSLTSSLYKPNFYQIRSLSQPHGDLRCVYYATFNLLQIIKGLEEGADVTHVDFIVSRNTEKDFENWLEGIKAKWQKQYSKPFKDKGYLDEEEIWMFLRLSLPKKCFEKTSCIYESKDTKYDQNKEGLKMKELNPQYFIFSIPIPDNHAITYIIVDENTIIGCDSHNKVMYDVNKPLPVSKNIVLDVYKLFFHGPRLYAHEVINNGDLHLNKKDIRVEESLFTQNGRIYTWHHSPATSA